MCQGQCHLRTAVQSHHLQRQDHLPETLQGVRAAAPGVHSCVLVSLDDGGQGGFGEGPEEGSGDGHQLEEQNVRGPACRGGHDDLGGQKGQGGHDRQLQGLV